MPRLDRTKPDAVAIPPLDAATVERFADLFGDSNPIHRSGPGGVATPVVPGSLLSVLIERAVQSARPDMELMEMQVSFLAPVPVGAAQALTVRDGPRLTVRGINARRARVSGHCEGRLSYLAECILTERTPGGA